MDRPLDTITVGTEMETGPNHDPTTYSTEATPISARLTASSARCVHLPYLLSDHVVLS